MNREDASMPFPDAFSVSAGSVARLAPKELLVRLSSAFHPEMRLLLVSTGLAATLQATVSQGPAIWTPQQAFLPEQHAEADLEPRVFRTVVALFRRMERSPASPTEPALLGGLHLSVEFTEGTATRRLDCAALASPAARTFARKVIELVWHHCRHPGLRGQASALAGYVGRRYASDPEKTPTGPVPGETVPTGRAFEMLL